MYTLLIDANATTVCDPFDGHVLACVFAAAVDECHAGGSFTDALGICGSHSAAISTDTFPGALERLEDFELDVEPVVTEDETLLTGASVALSDRAIATQFAAVLSCRAPSHARQITFGRILDSRIRGELSKTHGRAILPHWRGETIRI